MSVIEAIGPVIGGLFVKPVNSRIKQVVSTVVDYAKGRWFQGKNYTSYAMLDNKNIEDGTITEDKNIEYIERVYHMQWQSAEENEGLHLYINSARGLFCIHLATGSICQGLPWESPWVPSRVKTDLNIREDLVDRDQKVNRFRLNCLLNMLLKDLKRILVRVKDPHTIVPECLKSLVEKLQKHDTGTILDEATCISMMFTADIMIQLRALKDFLMNHRGIGLSTSDLFFKDFSPSQDELIKMPLCMGMIFHATLFHGIFLFATPIEPAEEGEAAEEFEKWNLQGLPQSLPKGKCEWLLMGRIRYTIVLP